MNDLIHPSINKRTANPQTEMHYNQALHELYISHERGEAAYAPSQNGWRHGTAFMDLVDFGEAKIVRHGRMGNPTLYRITLLGVITHRRMLPTIPKS